MADLMGIELARPGTWKLASGPLTVTPQMLDDAARFAAREGARPGYLKIGHTDSRFASGDGEPALGWVSNVRVEDDNGLVLKGDVTGMPDWLAAAAPTAWPDRSIEGYADYEHDGEKYSLVVDGLALLGVTPPGMSSIRSLRDLPAALGVAASASARRIIASFGDPQTPAVPAEVPTNRTGAGMDPVMIREALGLSTDASDDDVKAALTTAGLASDPPAGVSDPGLVHASGLMRVDASAWQEREDRIKRLEAQASKQREAERDQIIAQAVTAGKFAPARKEHWVRMWNADPEGARQLIDTLAKNVVPVMASGYSTDSDEDMDAEYASLFPPASQGGARRG